MTLSFKQLHSFERRINESNRIRKLHPDRIPIVCEKAQNQNMLPSMEKTKYLVPFDITVGQFITVIRKRLSLKPEVSLMISIDDGIIPPPITTMGALYEEHKYADGFLYIHYHQENTFG